MLLDIGITCDIVPFCDVSCTCSGFKLMRLNSQTSFSTLTKEPVIYRDACVGPDKEILFTKTSSGRLVRPTQRVVELNEIAEEDEKLDDDEDELGKHGESKQSEEISKILSPQEAVVNDIKDEKDQKEAGATLSFSSSRFQCKLCSFKAKNRLRFDKHLESHKEERLTCEHCDYKASTKNIMKRHINSKHPEHFSRECCGKTFLDVMSWKTHVAEHEAITVSCDYCSYKTNSRKNFERHRSTHRDVSGSLVSEFHCNVCDFSCSHKYRYERHMSEKHFGKSKFLCDICGTAFKRKDSLKQHHRYVHPAGEKPLLYQCQFCTRKFRSQAHLKEHSLTHSTVRTITCEHCGAGFKTKSNYKKHMVSVHEASPAYHCEKCFNKFLTPQALLTHMTTCISANSLDQNENAEMVQAQFAQVWEGGSVPLSAPVTAQAHREEVISVVEEMQVTEFSASYDTAEAEAPAGGSHHVQGVAVSRDRPEQLQSMQALSQSNPPHTDAAAHTTAAMYSLVGNQSFLKKDHDGGGRAQLTRSEQLVGYELSQEMGYEALRLSEQEALRLSGHEAIRLSEHEALGLSEHEALRLSEHEALRLSEREELDMESLGEVVYVYLQTDENEGTVL